MGGEKIDILIVHQRYDIAVSRDLRNGKKTLLTTGRILFILVRCEKMLDRAML
jgi:hypothetical protein